MFKTQLKLLLLAFLLCLAGPLLAQDSSTETGSDESSDQTEESEEAYRRRMELEGARDHETFSNTSYSTKADQQKIDKLPEESQKNIRNQITDIIIESDEWEPSDVLEDYPYEPTEEAMKDPVLLKQEEEAWAEQVDKYHEREAAAFGATRPTMPGNAGQQAGTPGSAGQQQGEPGGQSGAGGQNGEQGEAGESNSASGGSYDPNRSGKQNDGDEVSTAGVSESALDFLRGKRGQAAPGSGDDQQQEQPANPAGGGNQASAQVPALAGPETDSSEAPEETAEMAADASSRPPDGSLPIEQLEQLQGLAGQSEPQAADAPPSPAQDQQMQNSGSDAEAAPEQLTQTSDPAEQDSKQPEPEAEQEIDLTTAGIIAIRDLDKLEGLEEPEEEQP